MTIRISVLYVIGSLIGCNGNTQDIYYERAIKHRISDTIWNMEQIASHINLYYTRNGTLPDPEKRLYYVVKLYFDNVENIDWIQKKGDKYIAVDGWKREILYSIVDGKYRLISAGLNGIYEDGSYDDIVLERAPRSLREE